VPLISIVYTFESWPWGVTLCRLTEAAKDTSIGVSVFTLTALSADRYCAVVNPLRKLQTRSLTVVVAISIWVAAIICALPGAIISNVVTATNNNHTIQYCSPFGAEFSSNSTINYKKYSTVTKALVYYVIPLIIIAILYALMAHRLHSSARELIGENVGTQSRAQQQARKHVANMVITFIVIFFICFLPYHIFQLWFHLDPNSLDDYDTVWHVFRMVGFCLR
jgi:bombesin receptor subtype-3